jgi:hypothetical protein
MPPKLPDGAVGECAIDQMADLGRLIGLVLPKARDLEGPLLGIGRMSCALRFEGKFHTSILLECFVLAVAVRARKPCPIAP